MESIIRDDRRQVSYNTIRKEAERKYFLNFLLHEVGNKIYSIDTYRSLLRKVELAEEAKETKFIILDII